MSSFFYGTFMRASMNDLDSAMNSTFHAGGLTPRSSIAHTLWMKLKRRQQYEREPRQNESEIQKERSKVGGKNN